MPKHDDLLFSWESVLLILRVLAFETLFETLSPPNCPALFKYFDTAPREL
jgi:hypothetical protein